LVFFDGRSVRLGSQKGAEYIAALLACPGDPVHVLDLTNRGGNGHSKAAPQGGVPDAVLLSERARKAVTNRIRDTIDRIAKDNEEVGRHFRTAIRTGTFCRYAPGRTFDWEL
jgi:hypothetical protein